MDDVIDCEIEQAAIRDSHGVRVGYSYTTVRPDGDWCYTNAFDRHGVAGRTRAVRLLSGSTTCRHPSDWAAGQSFESALTEARAGRS